MPLSTPRACWPPSAPEFSASSSTTSRAVERAIMATTGTMVTMAMDMEAAETATPKHSFQATSADHVSASHVAGERAPERVILVPLESPALRLLVLIVVVVGAAWMAKVILSPAIADYLLSHASGISDLRRAVAWNPSNPALHLRLAHAYDSTMDTSGTKQAQHEFEMALRLQPTFGPTWLQLALLAHRLGERERARQALDTALRLDPHNVRLRW